MNSLVVFIALFVISVANFPSYQNEYIRSKTDEYFPLPDSLGGWRSLSYPEDIMKVTGIDFTMLNKAFDFVRSTTQNGGLLVVRHGYLVYEKYFGKGQREATPNLGSCGKSFTSISVGILMNEHPELFPDGLDQKIFTPDYLPKIAFPLSDPAKADIKLGQLLSFTAGIRGNNPVYINGKPSEIDTVGPDGWFAMTDEFALGIADGKMGNTYFSTKKLWCKPGGGFSYSTASAHIASIIVRHVSGVELEDYVKTSIADPLGWGRWGYGYKNAVQVKHTPGGGGIAVRSTDMLRFGYLLLHKGKWNNEQIVPKKFVSDATNATSYNPHFPYSFQFDVNTNGENNKLPKDAFWKIGSGGHCLYVVPSLDLVVWKMGGRNGQFSKSDTGHEEPTPLQNPLQPLVMDPSFKGDVYSKTLEMVINSITEKSENN